MDKPTVKKRNKTVQLLLILAIVLAVAAAGGGIYIYTVLHQDTFYEGVFVDDINLDEMTYQQAIDTLTVKNHPKLDEIDIQLTFEDKTWRLDAEDIHARINVQEMVDQAWAIGRDGSIGKRLRDINTVKNEPVKYYTQLTYDGTGLKDDLAAIAAEIDVEPVDATITFHQGEDPLFTFTPELIGRELLVDETVTRLMERVDNKQYGEMALPTQELYPEYYQSELETWTTRIASFRTLLHEDPDRTYNVHLSSSAYDGLRLEPGQTFSLNDTTGPRDTEHGYKDANVIVGGKKLEPAPGGGNCQTATTLYGTAVRADLTIVERYPHSFPSSYTEVGQDATVNYPYADIKIKNDGDTPVFFDRYFDGDWICINVYGKAPTEYDTIKIETVILEHRDTPEPTMVADSSLPVGTQEEEYKSRPYIKCETYRVYMKDGTEVKRVFEAKSVYPQVVGVTMVGTRMPDGTVVSLQQALHPTPSPSPSPTPVP